MFRTISAAFLASALAACGGSAGDVASYTAPDAPRAQAPSAPVDAPSSADEQTTADAGADVAPSQADAGIGIDAAPVQTADAGQGEASADAIPTGATRWTYDVASGAALGFIQRTDCTFTRGGCVVSSNLTLTSVDVHTYAVQCGVTNMSDSIGHVTLWAEETCQ